MKKTAIAVITIAVLTCSVMFADASTSVASDKVISKITEGKYEGIKKKKFSDPCLIYAEDGCVVIVKVVERDGRRAVITRSTSDQCGIVV